MTVEFEYTFDDLKEAQSAAFEEATKPRRHGGVTGIFFGKWIFGWIIFVGLAVFLFMLLNRQSRSAGTTAPAAAPSIQPDPIVLLRSQAWIFVLLIVGVVFIVLPRILIRTGAIARRAWKDSPGFQLRKTLEVDGERLIIHDVQQRVERKWSIFTRFVETTNLFILYTQDSGYTMIPKRALVSAGKLSEFASLLEEKISAPTRAFPVQPVQRP